MQQAALTSFVQQGMLEVQVMAEKKEKRKKLLGETRAPQVTGHILATAYLTPSVFVIAEFFLFLSLCLCLSVQSDN